LEESFFDALGQYFQLQPVVGGSWDAKVYICKRWKVTAKWTIPDILTVMNGSKEVVRGRSFGFIEQLFGSLEWD
jgi:hypothetical protein